MESYDAIIIGTGPNSLVNAAYLTKAGWSVLMLDNKDRPGGGLRTDEIIMPGFKHDVYAGFLILFAISRAYAELAPELAERGLTMANTSTPLGVSLPGGRSAVLTTSMEENIAEAERLAPGDGGKWVEMISNLGAHAGQVFTLLGSELDSPESMELVRQLMIAPDGNHPSQFAGEFLLSAREYLESQFQSEEWRAILAPWVFHAGRGPEETNSGFSVQLSGMGVQMAGLPIATGGAENMAVALAKLIEEKGGIIRMNTTVTNIIVENGKAVGVRTASGEEYRANRAVVATTNPDQLY